MRRPGPDSRFVRLGKITVGYGDKTEQEASHPGIDIAAASGTPIKAPVDGVVTKVDGSHTGVDNSFGNTVELRDNNGQVHQFHHLQNTLAKPGAKVRKGQPIAQLGATGAVYSPSNSDPSNLDYRIVSAFGQYVNPMTYVRGL